MLIVINRRDKPDRTLDARDDGLCETASVGLRAG